MKNLLLTIVLFCSSQIVFAHGDHQEMGLTDAIMVARVQVDELIKENKLNDSWKNAKVLPQETKPTSIKGQKRWTAVLVNESEKDLSKAKLEIVMTPMGKLVSHQLLKLEGSK